MVMGMPIACAISCRFSAVSVALPVQPTLANDDRRHGVGIDDGVENALRTPVISWFHHVLRRSRSLACGLPLTVNSVALIAPALEKNAALNLSRLRITPADATAASMGLDSAGPSSTHGSGRQK